MPYVNGKKRIMRKFRLNEISGVDVPAQEGASVTIMKRRDPDLAKGSLVETVTGVTNGHQHGIRVTHYDRGINVWVEHAKGPDDEIEHSHSLVMGADGVYGVLNNAGHTHSLDAVALATAIASSVQKHVTEEGNMTPEEKAQLDGLAKSNERLGKIVLLKSDIRAYFDGIDGEDAQDAFLAKSAEAQAAEVKKAADDAKAAEEARKAADPVVHTTADGVEIRKSDGPTVLALAKARDEDRKVIEQLTADNQALAKANTDADYAKRAAVELAHLPGTVEARAALLKNAEAIEDDDLRKQAVDALKANSVAMAPAFSTIGVVGGDDVAKAAAGAGDLQGELDALAEEHVKDNPGTSPEAAAAAVLKTARGADIYKRMCQAEAAANMSRVAA